MLESRDRRPAPWKNSFPVHPCLKGLKKLMLVVRWKIWKSHSLADRTNCKEMRFQCSGKMTWHYLNLQHHEPEFFLSKLVGKWEFCRQPKWFKLLLLGLTFSFPFQDLNFHFVTWWLGWCGHCENSGNFLILNSVATISTFSHFEFQRRGHRCGLLGPPCGGSGQRIKDFTFLKTDFAFCVGGAQLIFHFQL